MELYEFVLEIQDGEHEYTLPRYVAAVTPTAAAQYAERVAQDFRPHARYNAQTGWYEAPNGFPIWRVSSIRQVNGIVVPTAESTRSVAFSVNAVLPKDESNPRST